MSPVSPLAETRACILLFLQVRYKVLRTPFSLPTVSGCPLPRRFHKGWPCLVFPCLSLPSQGVRMRGAPFSRQAFKRNGLLSCLLSLVPLFRLPSCVFRLFSRPSPDPACLHGKWMAECPRQLQGPKARQGRSFPFPLGQRCVAVRCGVCLSFALALAQGQRSAFST